MDQKTIDSYNKLAKEYDAETEDFWERFPHTILDKFIEFTHGRVLDIGSGPGRDGLILQQRGLSVVCLDAAEEMVKFSSQKGLASIVGDFNALPFPDESFEGAWAYTSLLHVPKSEIDKPLKEIHRILKPMGIFGLGLIEGTTEEYRETAGVDRPRLFSFYTKAEIENLLRKNGFEMLYFEEFSPKVKNYLNFISRKI